jgi:hypothetical protein
MDPRINTGIILVFLGIFIILVGLGFIFIDKIPLVGKLPGDLNIQGKNWSFHFPLVTCIILSIVLTIILNIIFRR